MDRTKTVGIIGGGNMGSGIISGIVGSGNAIRRNRKLVEIIEMRFAQELKIPLHEEEAAYGAALFALISGGYFKNAAEASRLIRFM